jgi:hypothetical protein
MNVEVGMRNAEKEMVECQIVIFSAFPPGRKRWPLRAGGRIPNSEFQGACHLPAHRSP